MKAIHIEVGAALDQQGEPEEFSWDLLPVVPAAKTLHLQSNGLPKVGSYIAPGAILVGKIGKTKAFRAGTMSALDLHGLEFDALKAKYGHMWYDASYYAGPENCGVVVDARFETLNGQTVAVVVVDAGASVSPVPALGSGVPSAVSGTKR